MAITFDPTVGSRSNSYKSSDAPFHVVDEESILGDDDIWSHHARVTVRNGHNFDPTFGSRSNTYWCFQMPFFHVVDEESILGDDDVWSRHASVTVRNGHNF
jgi:hypothetical protein